jgi:putative acetyltransferase
MSDQLAAARSAAGHGGALSARGVTEISLDKLLLTLRPARDSDAAAVTALVRSAWSEFPGKDLLIERDAPDLVAPATSYAAQGAAFWVVERNGRIVASIALQPAAAGTVELRRFYVARDMRRSGLGAFLYRLFEEAALEGGAVRVELWTDIRMEDAHRLYERVGFARAAETRRCDETGIVRCRYVKTLAARAKTVGADAQGAPHIRPRIGGGVPAGSRWDGLPSEA